RVVAVRGADLIADDADRQSGARHGTSPSFARLRRVPPEGAVYIAIRCLLLPLRTRRKRSVATERAHPSFAVHRLAISRTGAQRAPCRLTSRRSRRSSRPT